MTTVHFKPANTLTFETVCLDKQRWKALIKDRKPACLQCDLSAVSDCDSAGLALLVGMRRLCHLRGIRLMMLDTPKSIRALAVLYGVESILSE